MTAVVDAIAVQRAALWVVFYVAFVAHTAGAAGYGRVSESAIDVSTLTIDEGKHLGQKLNGDMPLVGQDGGRFLLKDLYGKPLILVLSYYSCDGSCATVNGDLRDVIAKTTSVEPGKDFNVLTVSFDTQDTAVTATDFRRLLSLPPPQDRVWKHAVAVVPADAAALAARVGFRFFWSPRDRMFFHPSVYIFISPEGRIVRYLYSSGVGSRDLEVAVMEAAQGMVEPGQIGTLLVSYCYSYNYREGKYTLNLPIFIALGSLAFGGVSLLAAMCVHKRKSIN